MLQDKPKKEMSEEDREKEVLKDFDSEKIERERRALLDDTKAYAEYLKKVGFKKELVYYHVKFNPDTLQIIVDEYDIWADREGKCNTCGEASNSWVKIEHGSIVKTCMECQITGLVGIMKLKHIKRYKVTVREAEMIMRTKLGMNTTDIDIYFYGNWQKLKRKLRKARKQARPRAKK